MLSTITWTNRGNNLNDTDGFGAVFGLAAADAREVADAAFATWARVISNFNNGTNNIDISLSIAGTGIGGSGGVSTISDGRPTSGTINLAGGTDGLGGGYFIDPTPYDSSEFDGNITNAFVGNAKPGTDAAGKADFFTLVLLETTHVLGTSKNPSLRIWTSGLMFNTNIVIPAGREEAGPGAGGLNNTYWLFDGPSIDVLFNGSANTGVTADLYNAVHTASPTDPPVVYNGNTYYGSEDDANAFYVNGERYMPSRNVARVLQDAYGYSIIEPGQFGTFYTRLDDDGTLEIRTPAGNSNDTLDLQISGGNLLVTLGLGAPVLRADPTSILSVLPINDIDNIIIDMGEGSDTVTIHSLYGSIPIALNMGSGAGYDVLNVWGGAGYDAITVNSPSLVSTGITLTSFTGVEALNLYTNGGDADVYLPYGGSANTATINGSGSGENIILHSLGLFTPVTIFGNGGNDTITLAPSGGADIIQAAVTVDGGTGGDTLNLGNGTLASLTAAVTFNGGGGFEDKVVFNDQSTSTATTYSVTSATVTRSPTFGGLTYSDLDRIVLNCGSGADTVNLANAISATVDLHVNSGNDVLNVGGGNLSGYFPQIFDGGEGNDQITFDNHLDSTNRIWDMRNNEVIFGGLISLFTTSFETVGVLGGSGQDEFDFKGVLGQAFNVDGGLNTDTFVLGYQGSVFFSNPVTLQGGDGGDVFTINDAAVSAFTTLSMDGGNDFNSMNVVEPLATGYYLGPGYFIPKVGASNQGTFGFANMITTVVTGTASDNDFTIYSAGVDVFGTFTINGGSGNDSFVLAPQPSGYSYKNLTINGQPGTDTFSLDANVLNTNENYTIATNSLTIARGGVIFDTVTISSMDSVTLNCGLGNDTISMNQYSAGIPVTVNAGFGDDTMNVGGGDLATNITNIAAFSFSGQNGHDTFNVNNGNRTDQWSYTNNASTIQSSGVFVGYSLTLGHDTVEQLNVNAGSGVDVMALNAVALGQTFAFNAGAGGDGLNMPVNLSTILGPVYYDGGADGDNLNQLNNSSVTPATVHVDQDSVGAYPGDNFFPAGASLHFANVDNMVLTMGSGADTVYAQPNLSTTVSLRGGSPTTAPGDTLNLALADAENYVVTPTSATAGNVTSTNFMTLTYSSFETGPNIDDAAPYIVAQNYDDSVVPTIFVEFSEDVSAALNASLLELVNTTTVEQVSVGLMNLAYDLGTNIASFTFPGYPGGILPVGDYSAAILPGLPDLFGNQLAEPTPTLLFHAGPELLGDYNLNGEVSAADYTVWRNALGTSGLTPYSGADGSGDGTIGPEDYGIWKAHYGETIEQGTGSGGSAEVDQETGSQVEDSPWRGDKEITDSQSVVASFDDVAAPLGAYTVASNGSADFGELSRAGTSPSRLRAALVTGNSPRDEALVAWLTASRDRGRGRFEGTIEQIVDGTRVAGGTHADHSLLNGHCLASDGLLDYGLPEYVDAIFASFGGDL
jgi:hypothetical protein